jgi:hypothetical protein
MPNWFHPLPPPLVVTPCLDGWVGNWYLAGGKGRICTLYEYIQLLYCICIYVLYENDCKNKGWQLVISTGKGIVQWPQSRQSTRLFLKSSDLGPSTSSPAGECVPSHFGSAGGTHSLAGEGVRGSQFGRANRHCGTLVIYVLCGRQVVCRWLQAILGRSND